MRSSLRKSLIAAVSILLYFNLGNTDPLNLNELSGDKNVAHVKVQKWADGKDAATIDATIKIVHESVCSGVRSADMKYLCSSHFVQTATQLLLDGKQVNVVQIGAHVGFESNDPIASVLTSFLDKVASITNATELRQNFHWTFVEPSPPNFKRLETNLKKNAHLCDMKGVNAAVVSDLANNPGQMIFYGISDTIDPETGFDSKSNKMLPFWFSQISSLSREQVFKHMFVKGFQHFGLDIHDYVIETNVTSMAYSDLMKQVLVPTNNDKIQADGPLLILVDTEGFDCNIVEGISPQSSFLPKYLVFEHIHCSDDPTTKHLHGMGFTTRKFDPNVFAIHQDLAEYWPIV